MNSSTDLCESPEEGDANFARVSEEHHDKEENPLVAVADYTTGTSTTSDANLNLNLALARRLLYVSHFGNQFSELAWQFCLVIWLAQITNYESLLLVSTYGVTVQSFVGLGTPLLGRRIDTMAGQGRRVALATRLLAAENVCVVLATLCFAHLLWLLGPLTTTMQDGDEPAQTASDIPPIWKQPSSILWLIAIHLLGGLAQVLDKSFLVAVERDWIVEMATNSNSLSEEDDNHAHQCLWLSETNVTLKQMDLTCQVLAPAVSGWILSLFPTFGIIWVGLVNAVALLVEWWCMTRIARLVPSLNDPKQQNNNTQDDKQEEEETSTSYASAFGWSSLQVYFRQPVALAGLGLALLYFNVLTFSGMMTAYLVSKGMALSTIGMWRGVASTVGLLATCIYHQSAKHYSLQFTALWSICSEFLCLTFTFGSIFAVDDSAVSLALLIGGVLPSRIGLWVYDIAVTQLFQQSVAERVRGQVGGTQMSLNAWMELLPFGLAMVYHKPSQFYVLIVGGYVSVGVAMLLYVLGVYLPHVRRRRVYEPKESAGEFQLVPAVADTG
jgi:iron-regulated transporter 1